MSRRAIVAAVWALTACVAAPAGAQSPGTRALAGSAPHTGSVEIGGGLAVGGPVDMGSTTAELTGNPSTGSTTHPLFRTESELGVGIGFQLQVGVYLTRNLSFEGGFRRLTPEMETRVSEDAEDAADVTATETLQQYVIGGSVVYHFAPGPYSRRRTVPFVAAGAGYLRDLHDGSELLEDGVEYHATGGLTQWFSAAPRRLGLRVEGGISIRDGGFDLEGRTRTVPIAAVGLTYLF